MKENRRVKYTKMFLNESLLKFLAEKPISRITVKEICEEADVNRSTYYVYFTDPFDQLRKLEAEIMVDMAVYVDDITFENARDVNKQKQTLENILNYILQKKHIFQILLTKGGDHDLQKDILTFFGERLLSPVEKTGSDEEVALHYKYIYASVGAFGVIHHWIVDDSDLSVERVAQMILKFTESMRK